MGWPQACQHACVSLDLGTAWRQVESSRLKHAVVDKLAPRPGAVWVIADLLTFVVLWVGEHGALPSIPELQSGAVSAQDQPNNGASMELVRRGWLCSGAACVALLRR